MTPKKIARLLILNLLLLILASELVFNGYYYLINGRYLSVKDMLAAEQSSFDVDSEDDKQGKACNKHKNVLSPHPYLAFIHGSRPECNSLSNNTGHRGPDVPLHKDPGTYAVMILGGSVANQLFQFKQKEIQAYFEKKHPGKRVLVLNGSLEGWKQPQQLFMLQLYGDVIDAAISIEGFNEMIFNRRLDYAARFEAPFLPGYRKANPGFLSGQEREAMETMAWLFDSVNDNPLLSHSKTAYFISEKLRQGIAGSMEKKSVRNSWQSMPHLATIYALPAEWDRQQKRLYAISQYLKYLKLMQATANTYHIKLAIFLQPAPALYKPLSPSERAVVGELDYGEDYLAFEQAALQARPDLPLYSLLNTFASTRDSIYKDGIHYEKNSPGPDLVMQRIYQQLNTSW